MQACEEGPLEKATFTDDPSHGQSSPGTVDGRCLARALRRHPEQDEGVDCEVKSVRSVGRKGNMWPVSTDGKQPTNSTSEVQHARPRVCFPHHGRLKGTRHWVCWLRLDPIMYSYGSVVHVCMNHAQCKCVCNLEVLLNSFAEWKRASYVSNS
jgi:hypothetical protein